MLYTRPLLFIHSICNSLILFYLLVKNVPFNFTCNMWFLVLGIGDIQGCGHRVLSAYRVLDPLQKELDCAVMENYRKLARHNCVIGARKRLLGDCEGRDKKLEYRFGFKL